MNDLSLQNGWSRLRGLAAVAIIFSLFVWAGCSDSALTEPDSESSDVAEATLPDLKHAMKVQDRNTSRLMKKPGIVGTATGISKNGESTIVVYAKTKALARKANLPAKLDKVPVKVKVTGMFRARADETSRRRPAPIGFSMGHPDITAGTFGARVRDGSGNVYALSNNHVLADVNEASIGDNTLQPGPTDGGTNPADAIGTLSDFEPIDFSASDNTIDAAITSSSTANLGYATTSEGYGTPNSTPFPLDSDGDGNVDSGVVGLNVQKYGRTTGLTQGQVAEVNVTVDVCYEGFFVCRKSATFVDQLSITPGSFSAGGDSGSLIVTDDNENKPVGLLFAGSSSRTIANPINLVLDRFNITIDDGGGGGGGNTAPTADFTYTASGLTVQLTDQSSDPDGSVVSYLWESSDGATSTQQNPSYTFPSEGTYTVTLTVADDDGATDSITQDVTVGGGGGNTAPTADFTYTASGLTVQFIDQSSDPDGSVVSYLWESSDGAMSTQQNPSYTFPSEGTYTVTLTVTDDDGATDTVSRTGTIRR